MTSSQPTYLVTHVLKKYPYSRTTNLRDFEVIPIDKNISYKT